MRQRLTERVVTLEPNLLIFLGDIINKLRWDPSIRGVLQRTDPREQTEKGPSAKVRFSHLFCHRQADLHSFYFLHGSLFLSVWEVFQKSRKLKTLSKILEKMTRRTKVRQLPRHRWITTVSAKKSAPNIQLTTLRQLTFPWNRNQSQCCHRCVSTRRNLLQPLFLVSQPSMGLQSYINLYILPPPLPLRLLLRRLERAVRNRIIRPTTCSPSSIHHWTNQVIRLVAREAPRCKMC